MPTKKHAKVLLFFEIDKFLLFFLQKNRKYPDLQYDDAFKRIRNIYKHMLKRCYNEKCPGYKNWGGRGIKVCEEWRNDFLNFYNWAIENNFDVNKPWYNCTIDRIDNDGNYEPSNCRFATAKQQRNNQRKMTKENYERNCYKEHRK